MFLPDNVKSIIERLETAGHDAFAVGGAVRDYLDHRITEKREPFDYDIATSAFPAEIKEVFSDYRIVDIGEKHGTIALVINKNGEKIEITTFRSDGEYSDSRHPDEVTFTRDLKTDLSRRDFTVNAMAYSDKTGLIDPYGGENDLTDGILRCVGEPEKRFNEDALRIMRALRFMSERGFVCEENTENALRELKDNLKKISPERIAAEFDRLLLGDYAERIIMQYHDVLGVVFPEIIACAGFAQQNKYHIHDVLTHTAKAIAIAPKDRVIRLALFFHDIAKPLCFTLENNTGTFTGHQAKSAEIAEKTMRRLCYNKSTIYKVVLLIEKHDDKLKSDRISVKSLLNRLGLKTLIQLCELKIADDSAKSGFVMLDIEKHRHVIEKAQEIAQSGECYTLGMLAVNGGDLLTLGFKGKEIGKKLNLLLDKVITGQVENTKESLLALVNSKTK
ncbi:MAG: hypothetical protein FWG70_09580 [Oscillospiraceae bacterium]|nr:hypothetical protein [Oscillospiraceae bacterium]